MRAEFKYGKDCARKKWWSITISDYRKSNAQRHMRYTYGSKAEFFPDT